jgi:hypothetical protein
MKTKRNTNKKNTNKTRKKGGHKITYDYDVNIKAGTNKPLTGKHAHEDNCVACVLHSLGFMTKDTARYLQRRTPNGLRMQPLLDMINDTYGEGHTFVNYKSAESLKSYLRAGEATVGNYTGKELDGFTEWGHCFIVFHAKNGNLYSIDPQKYTVTLLQTYLSGFDMSNFYVLTEPSMHKPTQKFITTETVKKAIDKDIALEDAFLEV